MGQVVNSRLRSRLTGGLPVDDQQRLLAFCLKIMSEDQLRDALAWVDAGMPKNYE